MSTSFTLIKVFVFFGLIVSVALNMPQCSTSTTPECEALLALSPKRRPAHIKAYSTDKQIEMYLCSLKEHPPDTGLAYVVAERGAESVDLTVNRLKNSRSDVERLDLIRLLEVLSEQGHLRGRSDVVTAVSDIIDTMKINTIKTSSKKSLDRIRTNISG